MSGDVSDLTEIEQCAMFLANKCIEFANKGESEESNKRLFKMYAAYLIAIDSLTKGIKQVTSEFIQEIIDLNETDKRKSNL